jgi:nucleolar protein 56
VLFESSSGYALFETLDLDVVGQALEKVQETTQSADKFGKVVKLHGFKPFTSAANALEQINCVSEGVASEDLQNFLEQNLPKLKDSKKAKFQLGVADSKLGNSIVETTKIPCVCNDHVGEIIRGHARALSRKFVKGFKGGDYEKAQLGLAHSYSRAKVKFNVNRSDNMIIQGHRADRHAR